MNAVGVTRAYLLVEDLILLAATLLVVREPWAALLLFVLVKGGFFVCGLYDFRLLPTRPVFWTRLAAGTACGALIGYLLLGRAWPAFVLAFVPAVVLAFAAACSCSASASAPSARPARCSTSAAVSATWSGSSPRGTKSAAGESGIDLCSA
jgi:hypothetical protein